MAIADYVSKANDPAFYTRVLFLSLTTAQSVAAEADNTPNHAARVKYANRILRGEENAPLLAAHVISANGSIRANIDNNTDVPDGDIEFVLASIWDSRAKAFFE